MKNKIIKIKYNHKNIEIIINKIFKKNKMLIIKNITRKKNIAR